MRLSVLSINLWNINEPYEPRLAALERVLGLHTPDIVCLQENSMRDGEWQAERLARSGGYGYLFQALSGYWQGRAEGNAILSRYPFESRQVIDLPDAENDMPRKLLICRAVLGEERSILIANTHLCFRAEAVMARLRQAEVVYSALESVVGNGNAILCGDFNDSPDSVAIQQILNSPFWVDVWARCHPNKAGLTFSWDNPFAIAELRPGRRIDYCLVRGQLSSIECDLVCAGPELSDIASDHYALLASVKIADD